MAQRHNRTFHHAQAPPKLGVSHSRLFRPKRIPDKSASDLQRNHMQWPSGIQIYGPVERLEPIDTHCCIVFNITQIEIVDLQLHWQVPVDFAGRLVASGLSLWTTHTRRRSEKKNRAKNKRTETASSFSCNSRKTLPQAFIFIFNLFFRPWLSQGFSEEAVFLVRTLFVDSING